MNMNGDPRENFHPILPYAHEMRARLNELPREEVENIKKCLRRAEATGESEFTVTMNRKYHTSAVRLLQKYGYVVMLPAIGDNLTVDFSGD